MKALILAGGKGTRLSALTHNLIPKPMVKICGKPIMQHTVERLKENGITDIFVSVGYLREVIQNYFGDGSKFGVNIKYIEETQPLGSGGALFYVKEEVSDNLLVCPGDAVFDVDFDRMLRFHESKQSQITLFVHPNLHPYDSDLVVLDADSRVTEIHYKNAERNFYYNNCVNAGIIIVSKDTLSFFDESKFVNMEKDFVTHFVPLGRVYGYKSTEYVKDVGTPERFRLTEKDLEEGIVAKKNLKNKQKAVFLDRDGTINKYKGFISKACDVELLPHVSEAIKKINAGEYLAIVVSNQPVLARGEATFEEVDLMFKKIETLLGKDGAYLDGVLYCPHHPDKGFDGEVAELKVQCNCRKPKIGMLKKAEELYNLDLSQCVLIGDGNVDVLTAKNAGIPCIRVTSGIAEEVPQDVQMAKDLLEAVNILLGE